MKRYGILLLIISMIFCVACQKNDGGTNVKNGINSEKSEVYENKTEEKTETIVLYFCDSKGMALCKEERTVPSEDAQNPEFVVKELIKGTDNTELVNIISADTVLNSCKTEFGVCTVDLGNEFMKIQGDTSQYMAIYSVVNTLCAIDGIDGVRFLIDGKTLPVFGNYDFAGEFKADMSLVKE